MKGIKRILGRIIRKLVRYVCFTVAAVLLFFALMIGLFRYLDPPTSAFILSEKVTLEGVNTQQTWVDLDDISSWMPLAVIASEDQKFLQHWGLDTHAIAEAISDYRQGDGLRGASTISQQTAKNLFLWNGRQLMRKVFEAGLTLGLEAVWPKWRIMEVYLNIAEFGTGIYGVEAASQHYFGIPAKRLNQAQAARLAAVLPSPKRYSVSNPSSYVLQRVRWIERQMRQLGGVAYVAPIMEQKQ